MRRPKSPLKVEAVDGAWCVVDTSQLRGDAATVVAGPFKTRKAAEELAAHLAYHEGQRLHVE